MLPFSRSFNDLIFHIILPFSPTMKSPPQVAGYATKFDVIPLTRFGNQARSILNILLNVLSETQRKNWNCLSPARQNEFFNFSGVSLARSKMGKSASAGISNRKHRHRIATPLTPPQADGALKWHNK
jgi:hypothetical protein